MEGFFNYHYIEGKVLERKLARTKGKLYHLTEKGYPALLDGQEYVYGELITLDDFDNNIIEVDNMERYFGESNEQNEYNRNLIEVEILDDGHIEQAYAYKYNLSNDVEFNNKTTHIPYGDWRKFMNINTAMSDSKAKVL
jgi:gamma-glutamylcyclotransferase (GGCT)/AIG2-like uncharacterized protein YtfP